MTIEWTGLDGFWYATVETPGEGIDLEVWENMPGLFDPCIKFSNDHSNQHLDVANSLHEAKQALETEAAKWRAQEIERVGKNMAEVDWAEWPDELRQAALDEFTEWGL